MPDIDIPVALVLIAVPFVFLVVGLIIRGKRKRQRLRVVNLRAEEVVAQILKNHEPD